MWTLETQLKVELCQEVDQVFRKLFPSFQAKIQKKTLKGLKETHTAAGYIINKTQTLRYKNESLNLVPKTNKTKKFIKRIITPLGFDNTS